VAVERAEPAGRRQRWVYLSFKPPRGAALKGGPPPFSRRWPFSSLGGSCRPLARPVGPPPGLGELGPAGSGPFVSPSILQADFTPCPSMSVLCFPFLIAIYPGRKKMHHSMFNL